MNPEAEADSSALSSWLSASASLGPCDGGTSCRVRARPQTATCPELLPWLVHSTRDGGSEMRESVVPSRTWRLISGEE